MPGIQLELFRFGVYLMFPIGFMYYYGTNLDDRFAVHDFWPKPEECNKLPQDREEVKAEYERIVARQKIRQNLLEERRRQQVQHEQRDESSS